MFKVICFYGSKYFSLEPWLWRYIVRDAVRPSVCLPSCLSVRAIFLGNSSFCFLLNFRTKIGKYKFCKAREHDFFRKIPIFSKNTLKGPKWLKISVNTTYMVFLSSRSFLIYFIKLLGIKCWKWRSPTFHKDLNLLCMSNKDTKFLEIGFLKGLLRILSWILLETVLN